MTQGGKFRQPWPEMGSRVCRLYFSRVGRGPGGRGPVVGCPSLEEGTVTLSNLIQVVLHW